MTPIKISRGYSRSVPYKLSDGREIWTRHEACIEAEVTTEEIQERGFVELYEELRAICDAEVVRSIKAERDVIKAADQKQREMRAGTDALKNLPRL